MNFERRRRIARILQAILAAFIALSVVLILYLIAYKPMMATGLIIGLSMSAGYDLLRKICQYNKDAADIADIERRYK